MIEAIQEALNDIKKEYIQNLTLEPNDPLRFPALEERVKELKSMAEGFLESDNELLKEIDRTIRAVGHRVTIDEVDKKEGP